MISVESTDLGPIVKGMRKTKGMTQMEVSEAVGISESHLKKIESGDRKPGFETLNNPEQNTAPVRRLEITI